MSFLLLLGASSTIQGQEKLLLSPVVKVDDPTNFNYLREVLKNKKIVLLGEKTHNDGTTLQVKVDMIKYLHDSLGFNVLLVENGIYGTDRAWRDIVEKKDSAVGIFSYLFNLFPNLRHEHTIQLARYISNEFQQNTPLYIHGIDICGRSVYEHAFFTELEDLLNQLSNKDRSVMSDFEKFSLKDKRVYTFSPKEAQRWFKSINTDSTTFYGHKIIRYLEQEKSKHQHDMLLTEKKIPLLIQSIHSAIQGYPYVIQLNKEMNSPGFDGTIRFKDRDEYIYQNACWYIDKYFPNEKFIISMATMHTSKDMSDLRAKYDEFKIIKPVGEYLQLRYGDAVYSICFVNYDGQRMGLENFDVTNIPAAPVNSIEKTLHDGGLKYSFINLSDANFSEFRTKSLAPIFDKWYFTDWSKVYDGIFFIDKMRPAKPKYLGQRTGLKQPYIFPRE